MPKIEKKQLPIEARDVLDRIKKGGPFPYKKDGTVFRNREQKLPVKDDSDYYREYTVPTPGVDGRGARRIIVGKNGEKYYTEDHYNTFQEIVE